MRYEIKEIAEILSKKIELQEPVYEFGAYILEGFEQYNYQDCFRNHEYVPCDIRPGPGIQKILDIENLDLPDNSVGTVLLFDMIHHVKNFFRAIEEIYRVLNDEGLLVLSTTMHYKILDSTDYYRFTPNGVKLLLEPFNHKMIGIRGNPDMPELIFAMAYKTERKTDWQRKNFQAFSENFISFIKDPIIGFSKTSNYKLGVFFHYLTNQLKGQDSFEFEIL
jgi:SAM-dependent methyltransferase